MYFKNPTYKTFIKSNKDIKLFLDKIFYLPNLHKLKDSEIILLSKYIKKYINLN